MKKKKENNKKLLGYMAAGYSAKALQGVKTMAQSVCSLALHLDCFNYFNLTSI